MKLKRINILRQLKKERDKAYSSVQLLDDVKAILAETDKERQIIIDTLENGNAIDSNPFNFDKLDAHRIFHIEQIKSICIDYRLRFLDSKLFKADLPEEAISEVRHLEKLHNTKLEGFKIMAPSKSFKLENEDDPLLFAPIGNGYFYLIHKWGNDLHALRKLAMLPFRNIENLLVFMLFTSLILTWLVPHGNMTLDKSTFFILFLFMFKSVVGIVIYYAFSRGKNVSNAIWNSKYYNA